MRTFIVEPEKKVPFFKEHDVIVIGGGPAGVSAAIASARQGAKTLIVESTGAFGGMGTNGMVPGFCPYSYKDAPLIKGIGFEVLERLHEKNNYSKSRAYEDFKWTSIDAEKLKLIFDEMVAESGCKFLFFTTFSDVIMNKDIIRAVVVENKTGRQAFGADVFIDCSGDADVAFRAGVPFEKGDALGNLQASTLCFAIGNINTEKYMAFYEQAGGHAGLKKLIRDAETGGDLPSSEIFEYAVSGLSFREKDGILGLNLGHLYGVDGTDPVQVSKAMIDGRKFAHVFLDFTRKNIPGMENAIITASASLLGIRETRRIKGDFIMGKEAFYEGRHFEDDIACYDYPVDVHESKKRTTEENESENIVLYWDTTKIAEKSSFGIPFRVMTPKNIKNLLVAGRSVSADREMHGCIRLMPPCFAMGQAAGTAAALVSKQNIMLKDLNINKLRELLRKNDVCL